MPRNLLHIACFTLWLLFATTLNGCATQATTQITTLTDPAPKHSKEVLFGTIEFSGNLKVLQNWQKIISLAPAQIQQFSRLNDEQNLQSAAAWQELVQKIADSPARQKLFAINRFFNRWPYRQDQDIWQRNDYWATPLEFLRHSGDCEDYAICKYFALRYLGFKADQLRIVVLRDTIRSITHAVLAVYLNDDILILDNLSNPVFSHRRYQHYVPQYSVNEHHRWIHIKPRSKTPLPLERATGD